jgi:regulator of protease activity HflC (stomatin/prohibitin superfamily)
MQTLFVFAIIFFVIAAIVFLISRFVSNKPGSKGEASDRTILNWVFLGVLLVAGIMTFFSSFEQVSTKNVGIETAFGRTEGELSNGLHFIPPWDEVTEMDAAIQTDNHTNGECLKVRIANQQTACVDVSIRWRIDQRKADELYQDYHSFENVRDSLVTRELTSAVNNQLASYNPLNSISLGTPSSGGSQNPTLAQIAEKVTAQMRKEIGGQIEVLNTIIPILSFDTQTQERVNQLQQQIALTRIAQQSELTSEAQSKANKALSQSVNNSPNVLVAQCLDTLNAMVKARLQVPVGFSCWPGGSNLAGIIAGK